MFANFTKVESIDLRNADTSKVTDMSRMFYGCKSLTSLDLSNFNTSKVTDMYNMFGWCNSVTSLDLSNFDTSNVTNMFNMFNGDSSLTTIYVSEKWNTSKVSNSSSMFYKCKALVGGTGTAYHSDITDKTYAVIDNVDQGQYGYLTRR
jgi:surface protein